MKGKMWKWRDSEKRLKKRAMADFTPLYSPGPFPGTTFLLILNILYSGIFLCISKLYTYDALYYLLNLDTVYWFPLKLPVI